MGNNKRKLEEAKAPETSREPRRKKGRSGKGPKAGKNAGYLMPVPQLMGTLMVDSVQCGRRWADFIIKNKVPLGKE